MTVKSILSNIPKPGKELKRINVKGYVREGHPVQSYFRLELVNTAEIGKSPKNKPTLIDEFKEKAKQTLENYHKNKSDAQKLVLNLFGDGEHAIFDAGFERNKDFLQQVYEHVSESYGSMYPDLYYMDDVMQRLTDPKYLDRLHKASMGFEQTTKDLYGLDTIRTSPFTFKTKIKSDDEAPLMDAIVNRSRIAQKKQLNELEATLNDHNVHMDSNDNLVKTAHIVDTAIRGTTINENVLKNRILPQLIAAELWGTKKRKAEHIKQLIEPLNHHVSKYLDENLPDEFGNLDVLTQDPQRIKDTVIKTLNQMRQTPLDAETEKGRIDLLQKFKNMDAKEVPYQYTFMAINNATFGGFKDKKVLSALDNLGNHMTGIGFEEQKARHGYVYFSNNPMELLTMSPEGKLTSCQSISKSGQIGVNEYNTNIIASLYNDGNDFIMYTKSPNSSIKRERTSFRFEPEYKTLTNYEESDGKIYSQDMIESHLKNFIENNDKLRDSIYGGETDHIQYLFDEQPHTDKIREYRLNTEDLISDAAEFYKDIDTRFNEIKDSHDAGDWDDFISTEQYKYNDFIDEIGSIQKEVSEYYPMQIQHAKQDFDDIVFQSAIDKGSLLYGSPREQAAFYTIKREQRDPSGLVQEFHDNISNEFDNEHEDFNDAYQRHAEVKNKQTKAINKIKDNYKTRFGKDFK